MFALATTVAYPTGSGAQTNDVAADYREMPSEALLDLRDSILIEQAQRHVELRQAIRAALRADDTEEARQLRELESQAAENDQAELRPLSIEIRRRHRLKMARRGPPTIEIDSRFQSPELDDLRAEFEASLNELWSLEGARHDIGAIPHRAQRADAFDEWRMNYRSTSEKLGGLSLAIEAEKKAILWGDSRIPDEKRQAYQQARQELGIAQSQMRALIEDPKTSDADIAQMEDSLAECSKRLADARRELLKELK